MVAAAAIALLAATGATLATASTASAVDSSGCASGRGDYKAEITGSSVNFRSGPGTSYSSKGLLSKKTKVFYYCYKTNTKGDGWTWDYIKVTSGAHAGTKGWVRGDYVSPV